MAIVPNSKNKFKDEEVSINHRGNACDNRMYGTSEDSPIWWKHDDNASKGREAAHGYMEREHLFTLTEPMDSDYIPKIKTFKESSSWGVLESTITFVEAK